MMRRPALVLFLALAALAAGFTVPSASAARAASESPWAPVATPAGATWAVHDVTCVGSLTLALAGDGHVAVSRDAGHTWRTTVPGGHAGTAFTAVAFVTGGRGVLASGGLLLVTADWGATWAPPAFVGPGPTRAVTDVAMRGANAVAVGDGGMILSSTDSGATWRQEASPVTADLTSVALTADGTGVAGSSAGDVLVRTTSWAVAGAAGAPVTGVAAVATPVWDDAQPDLYAATEHDVLGSGDTLAFASLPGLPDLSGSWGAVAWAGRPDRSLLVAGSAGAGYFSPAGAWVSGATGLAGPVRAVAPAGQSAGYLLGADGRLLRTLSAGRTPAAVSLGKSRLGPGGVSVLSATVRVAAPGTLLLRTRVPGRSWTTLRTVPWTTDDWGAVVRFDLKPTLTHDYVLEFKYGGTTTRLAPVSQVTVVPTITTAKARYARAPRRRLSLLGHGLTEAEGGEGRALHRPRR